MNKTLTLPKHYRDFPSTKAISLTKNLRKKRILEHFDQLAPEFIQYRQKFAYYHQDIIDQFNFFLHEDDKILEVGCGTGELLDKLKPKNKTGLDFSEPMVKIATKRHPHLKIHLMDAEELTLTETFDVIILSDVLGFFENVLDVFKQLKKVCHENTRIYINYYNFVWEAPLSLAEKLGLKRKAPKQSWLSKSDIENLLHLAGFDAYRTCRRMLIPVYIPVISRFFNKYISRLPIINHLCLNQFIFAKKVLSKSEDYSSSYSVTVVVPARNESGNIEQIVKRIPEMGCRTEIIFIEGGSTDNTWEAIQHTAEKYKAIRPIKFARQDGKGKGDAVRKGYGMACGDILMILDADMTVPPEDLPKFYEALASGKGDFINGSRLVYPMEKQAMRILNLFGNKFFSMVFSWMLEQPIKDSLCGTKVMFRKDYIKLAKNRKFFGDFDPFGDFDLLFGAYKLNLKIIDLPIRYHERVYGDTNISRFRHGWILLKMCLYAARKIKFW